MTKEQKFEARLIETGLMDEWNKIGRSGRVAKADENGDIILFIHEDESDNYSEIHYPSFNVLRMTYSFVKGCILEWRGTGGDFEKRLDDWLAHGMCSSAGCPLAPVDVYFPASGLEAYYQDFKDDPVGIMDTSNNHAEDLVRQINEKWARFKDRFRPILCALYERDIDEITDADSFQIPAWVDTPQYRAGQSKGNWEPYMAMALRDMKDRWEDFAENYLMHIADGQDLDCILKFVRFDVCEGTGRDRIM